ncbi:MAG: hypothetical protein ACK55Z_07305 [bacterium]
MYEQEYLPSPRLRMPGIMPTGPAMSTLKVAPFAGSMKLSMH